jgi:hypothetical protein
MFVSQRLKLFGHTGSDAPQVFGAYRASLPMPRAANFRGGSPSTFKPENVECAAYGRSFVAALVEFGTVFSQEIREGLRIFH